VTLGASDPISGLGTTSIVVDGGAPVAADGTPVLLQGEGGHTVTMTATDIAGNQATSTAAFLIDTVAPVVALPAAQSPSPAIPTVTPNGDAMGESLAVPYAVSEAATVTAIVTNAAGAVVRTITANAVAGTGGAEWDGRSVKGVPVPDGRYAVTLTATDPAGNVSTPVSTPIDVYSALTSVSRTLGLFYPQDGDALAPTSAVTFRLLTAARVSIDIVNVNGDVVRRVWADRAVAAGNASWSWNGRLANGAWAPRGTYRLLVRASNGEQAATGVATVIADAYRTVTSTTSPARGSVFTITAVTAERLSTTPRVTVRQPGLAAWSVTMKKVGPTTWKASIRPKAGGKAGSMSLTIQAKDAKGATNGKILRLVLR
jgi:flagellar hook assembly protein FlgD